MSVQSVCENCNKVNDIGRFCSTKCARSFSTKNSHGQTKKINCGECSKEIEVGKRTSVGYCEVCRLIKRKKTINKRKKKIVCKFCGSIELKKNKMICEICRVDYYENYRFSTSFDFEIKKYKEFFDISLVEKFGWYSPSNKRNNLTGVSKDHMFSVNDGFKLKINPELIKHPANCQLLLHSDNQKKRATSSITLKELLNRIIIFESKIKTTNSILEEVEKMTKCLSGLRGQSAKLLSES